MTKGSSAPVRAAIYARMSTDKQSESSPRDQIARCREFADREGWDVVEDLIAADEGISGASRYNRPALLDLMGRMPEWDVLLCWDFSRLTRDSEDLGWIRNRLRVGRKTGFEASTGLDIFNVGSKVMGVLAEEYLVKLRADTHRGLRGAVERGLSTGGRAYGYRSAASTDGAGVRIEIDVEQAAVVRRIFAMYLAGASLREIAHRLNAEGITTPRPRRKKAELAKSGKSPTWAPSALRAILLNPIYRGDRIWNKTEWIKDHETGIRRRFVRPESEWIRADREDLAIVDAATFEALAAAMQERGTGYRRTPDGRLTTGARRGVRHRVRTRYPLSGFLACAECGGSFFAVRGGERYGCGQHRDRGPLACGSTLFVPRTVLEERIFGAIRERILVPENLRRVVVRALGIVRDELLPRPTVDRARLAEIDADLRMLHGIAERRGRAPVATLLAELEAERRAVLAPPRDGDGIDLTDLEARIEARAMDLGRAFADAPEIARDALRALLKGGRIKVGPDPERGFRVEGLFFLSLEIKRAAGLPAARVGGSGGSLRKGRAGDLASHGSGPMGRMTGLSHLGQSAARTAGD